MSNELFDVLTAEETAAYLRVSLALLYRLAQTGKIPAAGVGRCWGFRRELLDEWLNRRMWENLEQGSGEGQG